ncbi:MAG: hypothetical protein ACOC37_02695 [Spirochaetota bacterium]
MLPISAPQARSTAAEARDSRRGSRFVPLIHFTHTTPHVRGGADSSTVSIVAPLIDSTGADTATPDRAR